MRRTRAPQNWSEKCSARPRPDRPDTDYAESDRGSSTRPCTRSVRLVASRKRGLSLSLRRSEVARRPSECSCSVYPRHWCACVRGLTHSAPSCSSVMMQCGAQLLGVTRNSLAVHRLTMKAPALRRPWPPNSERGREVVHKFTPNRHAIPARATTRLHPWQARRGQAQKSMTT